MRVTIIFSCIEYGDLSSFKLIMTSHTVVGAVVERSISRTIKLPRTNRDVGKLLSIFMVRGSEYG